MKKLSDALNESFDDNKPVNEGKNTMDFSRNEWEDMLDGIRAEGIDFSTKEEASKNSSGDVLTLFNAKRKVVATFDEDTESLDTVAKMSMDEMDDIMHGNANAKVIRKFMLL